MHVSSMPSVHLELLPVPLESVFLCLRVCYLRFSIHLEMCVCLHACAHSRRYRSNFHFLWKSSFLAPFIEICCFPPMCFWYLCQKVCDCSCVGSFLGPLLPSTVLYCLYPALRCSVSMLCNLRWDVLPCLALLPLLNLLELSRSLLYLHVNLRTVFFSCFRKDVFDILIRLVFILQITFVAIFIATLTMLVLPGPVRGFSGPWSFPQAWVQSPELTW